MSNELTVTPKLTPDVWKMIESVAAASFESRKFGIVKQGEAEIKTLFCYENGLPLTASNTGLYIVNGRLAVQSNIISAKFRMHPNYDYKIKEHTEESCVIEVYGRFFGGEPEVIGVSKFDKQDALKAGLLPKDVWKNYPRNMYFGRAITNAYRWYAPDLFSQPIYIPEELGVNVDSDGSPIIDSEFSEVKITLQSLQEKYSIEEILEANNGKIPNSQDEFLTIDKKLGGESDE